MKIRPVRAELFHADRRTDMMIMVVLRNFANAPNKPVAVVALSHCICTDCRVQGANEPLINGKTLEAI